MKNIKNIYLEQSRRIARNYRKKQSYNLCRNIASEKLSFKKGSALGSLCMAEEDGATKRKIRRIVEKRVCQDYWKAAVQAYDSSNKHRYATARSVSKVTRRIFGRAFQNSLSPVA